MVKIAKILIIFLLISACDNVQNNNPKVKKSLSNICHQEGTQYYKQTRNFKPFNSIEDCLNSGGRLPR